VEPESLEFGHAFIGYGMCLQTTDAREAGWVSQAEAETLLDHAAEVGHGLQIGVPFYGLRGGDLSVEFLVSGGVFSKFVADGCEVHPRGVCAGEDEVLALGADFERGKPAVRRRAH
jgi:hypothetical protein